MNRAKLSLVAAVIAALAAAIVAAAVFARRNPEADAAKPDAPTPAGANPNVLASAAASQPVAERAAPGIVDSSRPGAAPATEQSPAPVAAPPPTPAYKPGPSKFRKAKEPTARVALEFVGADQEAEAVWLAAINDPSVPAGERKDLIEDLNEDGISDPRKPAQKDLALIQSRIVLIERLLTGAMDRVNAEAFREAKKDLLNMEARLLGK